MTRNLMGSDNFIRLTVVRRPIVRKYYMEIHNEAEHVQLLSVFCFGIFTLASGRMALLFS